MKNTIVCPGSFDPWTYGHQGLIEDYLEIAPNSNVDVLIGVNPDKKSTFQDFEKKILIEKTLPESVSDKVNVVIYEGLIADYVYENDKIGVLKGARSAKDFEYEKEIAYATKQFSSRVKTIIIPQLDPLQTSTSSSALKIISKFSGDVAALASPLVREALRMKQSGKFILGVTGGIASGKSTLCQKLNDYSKNEALKIHYINFDQITSEIHTRIDLPIFQNIRNQLALRFGSDILNQDGTTNKKILGNIVFSSSDAMKELMDIMIEPLIHFLRKKVDSIKNSGIILVEGAIIFDRNLTYLFDENIMHIGVDREEQENRVRQRDNLSPIQISHRLANQLTREERVSGIQDLQLKYKNQDRLFVDVDGKDVDIEEIYKKIAFEYDRRKEFKYK